MQPGCQHTVIHRLGKTAANPYNRGFDAEFIMIERSQRLAKSLGHTIKPVRARRAIGVQQLRLGVIAYHMIGAGK